MSDYVSRQYLLNEYDRQHQGPPGGARKIIAKAPAEDAVPKERIVEYMDEFGAGFNSCRNDTLRSIESLTPADVAPVVHAYWIPQKENHEFKEAWMKCSACGYPVSRWTGNTNFCPNCGAKMDA